MTATPQRDDSAHSRQDLAALWREHEAISRRFDALDHDIANEESDRLSKEQFALYDAIQAQDPHDLTGILVQLRALADEMEGGHRAEQYDVLVAIIGRLEALGTLTSPEVSVWYQPNSPETRVTVVVPREPPAEPVAFAVSAEQAKDLARRLTRAAEAVFVRRAEQGTTS